MAMAADPRQLHGLSWLPVKLGQGAQPSRVPNYTYILSETPGIRVHPRD